MQKRQNKSVFISSTYKDLVELRKKVADRLHGLFLSVIRMEHFGATSKSTLENSLKELGKGCNYYILIIGHNYGTIPEGQDISITHSEFKKAVEMKNKKEIEDIFVFKGSLGTPIKLTTSGRGKLTTCFAGEDFQFRYVSG
jgi:hypothetical protein